MDIRVTHGTLARGTDHESPCLLVYSPYSLDFVARARQLGGHWQASNKAWRFDVRDEEAARSALRAVYGWDEYERPDLVQCVVTVQGSTDLAWFAGREVARRPERDRAVRLGEGVSILRGSFPRSGGSRNNPVLSGSSDLLLLVRDVPRSLVRDAQAGLWVFEPDVSREQIEGVMAAKALFGVS